MLFKINVLLLQTNYKTCYYNTFAKIKKLIDLTIEKMENFAKIDFRTPAQKKREEARLKVCKVYQQTMEVAPKGTSRNRIITVVAYQLGMTPQGVKNILVRNGLYKLGLSRKAGKI